MARDLKSEIRSQQWTTAFLKARAEKAAKKAGRARRRAAQVGTRPTVKVRKAELHTIRATERDTRASAFARVPLIGFDFNREALLTTLARLGAPVATNAGLPLIKDAVNRLLKAAGNPRA